MSLEISLSPDAETKLKERASAAGKDPSAYASELIEQVVKRPSLDEMLAPFRTQVAQSGMSDEQLDAFYEELRDEAWQGRQGREECFGKGSRHL